MKHALDLPTESKLSPLESSKHGMRAPFKVAYVVHTFDVGGLERCVSRLLNGLHRDLYKPLLVCLDRDGSARDWVTTEDVRVLEINKSRGNDWRAVGRLARVLRQEHVDIVHSHNWGTLLESVLARRLAKTPIHVHAVRGMEFGAFSGGWLRGRLRLTSARWAFQRVDCTLAVAESVREYLRQRYGHDGKELRVIPNGVDIPSVSALDARNTVRRRLGVGPGALLAGSVGRLVAVKDFGVAVQAISQLVSDGHDFHLILVGDGPERSTLSVLAARLGIANRVHLVGARSDIGDWLAAMDVYLNVSRSEGMSQSILEAMAAGLPIIATDVGESAMLIGDPESCGLVVPPSRPAEVAQALLQMREDEARKQFCSRAHCRHRDRHSTRSMIANYESLYSDLLASRRMRRLTEPCPAATQEKLSGIATSHEAAIAEAGE